MARVTIDEEIWTKVFNISNRLGWKKREVSGLILDLWHTSQRDDIAVASREEIIECCELWNEEDAQVQKIIDCLVWQKILIKESDGSFTIKGNQKHIDNINAKRRNGKKGGKKKADAPKEEVVAKTEEIEAEEVSSKANANLETDLGKQNEHLGLPLHNNTLQNNTKHSITKHSTSVPSDRGKINYTPNDLIQLWNKLALEMECVDKLWSGVAFGGGRHQENFLASAGYPELQTIEGWEKVFLKALESEWLTTQGPLSLTWLLNYDNVLDILAGKYSTAIRTNSNDDSGDFDYSKLSKEKGA